MERERLREKQRGIVGGSSSFFSALLVLILSQFVVFGDRDYAFEVCVKDTLSLIGLLITGARS